MSRIINPITFKLTKKQHKSVSDYNSMYQPNESPSKIGTKLTLIYSPIIFQDYDNTYDFAIRQFIFENKQNNKKFKVNVSYYKKDNGNYVYNSDDGMQDLTVTEII